MCVRAPTMALLEGKAGSKRATLLFLFTRPPVSVVKPARHGMDCNSITTSTYTQLQPHVHALVGIQVQLNVHIRSNLAIQSLLAYARYTRSHTQATHMYLHHGPDRQAAYGSSSGHGRQQYA